MYYDQISLERRIDEAIARFDQRLAKLYSKRIFVEKCILAEELKLLIHDRHLSMIDELEREEEKLM